MTRHFAVNLTVLLPLMLLAAVTTKATSPRTSKAARIVMQTISRDTVCRAPQRVGKNVILRFANGAKLIKGEGCSIYFEGTGIADPESPAPVFVGFTPGDILWSGKTFPKVVSAKLWDKTDVSDQIKSAIAALAGRRGVTIKVYPGNLGSTWQLKSGQSLYLTRGIYTSSVNAPDAIEFFLESNTSIYGDGPDATIVQESSSPGRNVRVFGPSGFKEGPFAGGNDAINIHDLAIEGNPRQSFVDNGPTTIMLGNCTDCHARRVRLKDTHAYGIFIGGFHSLGFSAKNSSIEYCEFDHVIAQNSGALNGINISIVHNKYWNLGKLPSDPISNAIDIEPNAPDEITENIVICDNEIDGRGAKAYWNGILVQIGGSKHEVSGGQVCRNTIIGRDLPSGAGAMLNGLTVAGAYNIGVFDNQVQGAMQSGMYLNLDRSLDVHDNTLTGVAPGGIFAVRVENVTNSMFTNNSLSKTNGAEDDRFVEIGRSGNNVYSGNKRGAVVLLGGSRERSHQ